jgi:hypothetical protein
MAASTIINLAWGGQEAMKMRRTSGLLDAVLLAVALAAIPTA